MAEKFSGIRVLWDGFTLKSATKNAPIPAPSEMVATLPKIPFEAVMHYSKPTLLAFDAPNRFSDSYEQRLKFLEDSIPSLYMGITSKYIGDSPWIRIVKPYKVASMDHVMEAFQTVLANGLALRKPSSRYLESDSFLKMLVRKYVFLNECRIPRKKKLRLHPLNLCSLLST